MNFSLSSANGTVWEAWTFSTVFTLTTALLIIPTNLMILVCFLKDTRLRQQPFSIYLMCLLLSNLLSALFRNTLEIVNHMHPVWVTGKPACVLYQYSLSFITSYQLFTHVLISLNRVWAVTFPYSYRRHHSRKTALFLCACMCVYVHLILLPNFVINMAAMKSPMEIYGCQEQSHPHKVHQIMIFVLAQTIVIASYPYIAYKRYQYISTRGKILPGQSHSNKQSASIKPVQTNGVAPSTGAAFSAMDGTARPRKAEADNGGRAFLVLTLLTCSTTICWTPGVVLFTVNSYKFVYERTLFGVILTIFAIQPVLDPLLFAVALQDLRAVFRNLFSC